METYPINGNWAGQKKKHFWGVIGHSKGNERNEWKGEIIVCSYCKQIRVNNTIIGKRKLKEMEKTGMVVFE